ncbi:hypothetical protein L6250_02185 [Candidatus Parcubacteria bacterium]|nr:hypothetical protein [Patescibacteria group bacterium]MCG2688425.1 hypothetical protein [Candidatus Parcubacteria bacterium]
MAIQNKPFIALREKYPQFSYEKFSWKVLGNDLQISFSFKTGEEILFSSQILIKEIDPKRIKKVGNKIIDNLVFNLGLIEMISYWKATCSPEILIKAGSLSQDQIKWWKDLIFNGMGQYFYENQINFMKKDFLRIKLAKKGKPFRPISLKLKERYLVPVGGGKDSVVTIELLKEIGKEINCFSLNPSQASKQVIKIAGYDKLITVFRKIDPKLLELNKQNFLNGHTPFTAYLSFLSVLIAVIFDYKLIAFSNEQSANEGNVWYFGKEVNHQYSKTFKFEKGFRNYLHKYLVKGIEYFSLLRPLYELQIAKIFTNYPKYFKSFLSCNQGAKDKNWCGKCPKCLFVYTCLFPFLSKAEMKTIFGQDLFTKSDLLETMKELIGESDFKPFECVGTKKESIIAFYLSFKKARDGGAGEIPFLLTYFKNRISPRYFNLESESRRILSSYDTKHYVPTEMRRILRDKVDI